MAPRQAGVLLHLTSLPNEEGQLGCLNHQAWRFLAWMEQAGLQLWQTLPLNHTHADLSPYSALSAFALNPAFLPKDWQQELQFAGYASDFEVFCQQEAAWLDDYALFIVLRDLQQNRSWLDWPTPLKLRDPSALAEIATQHHARIEHLKQQQFVLNRLWQRLKQDAHQRGITLFGDMPIFVALDSADVWAHSEQFLLDEQRQPIWVAGVPPDYFSETGQRWGNPHYDWARMAQEDFAWWQQRIAKALQQFDLLRIDHFRGLQACWQIAASEPTAVNGHWQEVPGAALLQTLSERFTPLPLVAEDLGLITPEVIALKEQFALPGMAVLQFGFNGLPDNPHALASITENSVIYTGTHDNDTTLGWFEQLDAAEQSAVQQTLAAYWQQNPVAGALCQSVPCTIPWSLIVAAFSSPAQRVLIPMQDFLGLDGAHRMNVPGVAQGNWRWQMNWDTLPASLAPQIAQLVEGSRRQPKPIPHGGSR
ncbi:MAG: 4-alpha-glucanotransferase [Thiotrichales bacterium]|nr:4-alpha-glucanotransferase [Thiotrichales bacterium]